MANRRMGTRKITGTIDFLNLPKAAQAFYQQCVNESDDDGIVDARMIMRIGNFRKRDLDALIDGDYVRLINAKKSIVWVTNWQSFNTIKPGTGTPSTYRDDLLRSVPDIKNALFTPKTGNKKRKNDGIVLESESEREEYISKSVVESGSEPESEPETGLKPEPNTARMATSDNGFFIEKCPDAMEYVIQDLVYDYGDEVETRLMCIVAIKLFRLEIWKPTTCGKLATKFVELNGKGLRQKWSESKWQKMLDGFVESELTESNYDEWLEDEEEQNKLPFG